MRLDDERFHELKIYRQHFEEIKDGLKKFEYRKDDRGGFEVGDRLNLREFDPVKNEYTTRAIFVTVTSVMHVGDHNERMVIMSIA